MFEDLVDAKRILREIKLLLHFRCVCCVCVWGGGGGRHTRQQDMTSQTRDALFAPPNRRPSSLPYRPQRNATHPASSTQPPSTQPPIHPPRPWPRKRTNNQSQNQSLVCHCDGYYHSTKHNDTQPQARAHYHQHHRHRHNSSPCPVSVSTVHFSISAAGHSPRHAHLRPRFLFSLSVSAVLSPFLLMLVLPLLPLLVGTTGATRTSWRCATWCAAPARRGGSRTATSCWTSTSALLGVVACSSLFARCSWVGTHVALLDAFRLWCSCVCTTADE